MARKTPPQKQASTQKPRTRNLTFLLLRNTLKDPQEALKNPAGLTPYPLDSKDSVKGCLYLAAPSFREPRWLGFLKEGFDRLPSLTGSFPMGVLFIEAESRLFAMTLGQGRNLLKSDSFELDFGLKVTLNSADPKKLRSLDLRTFEELTVHTRRQVSRGSSLNTFDIDVSRDVLRAFTGEPRDPDLAKRFTGKDALVLNGPIAFSKLSEKCTRLLAEFTSDQYKQDFPWVDNIKAIRDPATVARLDATLLDSLKTRRFDRAHLAPPDMIDWTEAPGFLYPGERGDLHSDLDLEECLEAVARLKKVEPQKLSLTIADLKQLSIRAVRDEAAQNHDKWSIYDCLVFELDTDDGLHALTGGQWFRIEKAFVKEIEGKITRLAGTLPLLPPARPNQNEDAYNRGVSRASPTVALLDKKLIRCTGARTSVEPCDLLTENGTHLQFIHVKRKTRSSTLSHLFAQGVIAAEAFLGDKGFRTELKNRVGSRRHPNLCKRLGDPSTKPTAHTCEIIYAVITSGKKPQMKWPLSLPFFSQLNLANAADRLEMLGCKVLICRIEERR